MKLSTSFLCSAAAHAAIVAIALLGSWEHLQVEHITEDEFAPHAVTLQRLYIPQNPRTDPPEEDVLAMTEEDGAQTPKEALDSPRGFEQPEPDETPPQEVSPPEPDPPEPQEEKEPAEVAPDPPAEEVAEEPDSLKPVVAASDDSPTKAETADIAERDAGVTTTDTVDNLALPRHKGGRPAAASNAPAGASVKTADGGDGLGGGIDRKGLIRAYHESLLRTVNRSASAPRAARRAKLEGTVFLRVTFDARGHILSIKVRKSSGHEILDRDAIDTLRRIGQLPAPPTELQWERKSLTIPIRYKQA